MKTTLSPLALFPLESPFLLQSPAQHPKITEAIAPTSACIVELLANSYFYLYYNDPETWSYFVHLTYCTNGTKMFSDLPDLTMFWLEVQNLPEVPAEYLLNPITQSSTLPAAHYTDPRVLFLQIKYY